MLEVQQINITELKQYIEIAFEGDKELINFYDKNSCVSNHNDMSSNTHFKLTEYKCYFDRCFHYKVVLDNTPIGFIFITKNPNLLVSFSVNKKYRNKETLKKYFELIQHIFSEPFICLLYNENYRAINWLEKCGMEVESIDSSITKLKI
jgi:hypothetical protein